MVCRYIMAGALAMALLPAVGCSKTQDTAPQTKIFGQPPVIKSATLNVTQNTVLCDFTAAMDVALAQEGMQVAPGPFVVGGTYTQFLFQAQVTDPNSTPGNNDIILVSASGVIGASGSTTPNETTLVMLDDGSSSAVNNFTYSQQGDFVIGCTTDSAGQTTCQKDENIPLTSNDPVANDGTYTRGFAFVNLNTSNNNGSAFLHNCIAKQAHQFPQPGGVPNTQLTFRFDAVDKEGNLTTFPTRKSGVVGTSTFLCSGDACLCCYLQNVIGDVINPGGKCRGLPGMIGPANPTGLCNSF